jgi:hypothetical protein
MMNHARIDVALQGIAHATRAHQIAKAYARERIQGRDPNGPVTIEAHPAVRDMLGEQRALALAGRLMCHQALVALESGQAQFADFLTPVCKVFCTEAGMRSADLGIQILGGYGYLREYRVEQTWRDARVTAIYEGTNEIHGLSLATRALKIDDGAAAQCFAEHIKSRVDPEEHQRWSMLCERVTGSDDPASSAQDFMQATCQLAFMAAIADLLPAAPSADAAALQAASATSAGKFKFHADRLCA